MKNITFNILFSTIILSSSISINKANAIYLNDNNLATSLITNTALRKTEPISKFQQDEKALKKAAKEA